jgi:hypothetical protein
MLAILKKNLRGLQTISIMRNPDFPNPFILFTDASGIGLGAVLSQKDDEGTSHCLCQPNSEQNYPIIE